jgi:predicted acetyltransferase
MLKLAVPGEEFRERYIEYIVEWEDRGDDLVPAAVDPKGRDFDGWLRDCLAEFDPAKCPPGKVASSTYFLVNNAGRIVGAVNIRHELNDYLFNIGGHIGYGIRPSERGKGYAKRMLALALEAARELGLERVLVSCHELNRASARTILANGGVLEDVRVDPSDGERIERYWIDNRKSR